MSVQTIVLTGQPELDALLFGSSWNTGANGAVTTALSYSFAGLQSLWPDYGGNSEPVTGFQPFSADSEHQAAHDALLVWASVTNLQFQEVADDATGAGTIRIGYTTLGMDASQLAYAYAPAETANGGDVWVNAQLRDSIFSSFMPGSLASYVLLHELGHTLGLKHPHAASPLNDTTLNGLEDSLFNSVMSYYAWPGVVLTKTNIDRFPATAMALDIEALQALYGANTTYRNGNDTYTYDASGKYLETIYDTGGDDTIQVIGSRDAQIDLRPDQWSRIGIPVQIAGGAIQSAETVRLYATTQIENAVGGAGNDMLTGNDGNNSLNGMGGNDTLEGGAGTDTAEFSGKGFDYKIVRDGGRYLITDTNSADGDDGTDLISAVERLAFADRALDFASALQMINVSVVTRGGMAFSQEDPGRGGQLNVKLLERDFAISFSRGIGDLGASGTKPITEADALDALRLSVGLDASQGGSWKELIAADMDHNGRVTAADALEILKTSAGINTIQPAWVFVPDDDPGLAGMTRHSVIFSDELRVSPIAAPASVTVTAILVGDVNNNWMIPP